MKKFRLSEVQIIGVLKEVELDPKVGDACPKHGVSDAMYQLLNHIRYNVSEGSPNVDWMCCLLRSSPNQGVQLRDIFVGCASTQAHTPHDLKVAYEAL